MQIVPFLPHYQLVYINFDFSSFSLISYMAKEHLLPCKRASFTLQKSTYYDWVVNLSYKRGEGEIKQSTSDLFKDYQYRFFVFLHCVWLVYE